MSYAYSAAQVIVNLIYVPLLLQGIGKAEYGLFQMIGSVIAYLYVINSTLSAGATRYYSKYYVLNDTNRMANTLGILKRIYRWANLLIAVAAVILVIIVRAVYAHSFTPWEVNESCLLIGVLAINLIVTMNNTISIAVITAHEEFVFLKAIMLFTTLLQPLLVILAIHFSPYALTVSLVQLAANTICRTLQHEFAKWKLGMDSRLRWLDTDLQKNLLTFSGTIILALVADQIFWKTDQLILGYMFGTAVVAVYSVGSQVVNAYLPLGTAISSVFLPKVSELWHKDHDITAISDLFTRVSRLALYPLLIVLTSFIIFGPVFIELWAGKGYQDAYWVAVIELTPFTIDLSQNIGLTILQVMNRYGFRAKMYVTAAIINIGLTIVLASKFSSIGAAISSAIAMLISSGLILNIYYAKVIKLDMLSYWKSVLRQQLPIWILFAAGLASWHFLALPATWINLLVGLVIYCILFSLVCYFFSANQYEKEMVQKSFQKITNRD